MPTIAPGAGPVPARRRREPIEVEHRDGVPVAFVRGARRYRVARVLAHWLQTEAWWARPEATLGVADDEREVWQVEAAYAGRVVAVVQLTLTWSTGRWVLTGICD